MTPSSLELFRKIIRFGIVTRSISRIIFEHLANRPWLCPLSYEDPTCMFGHFCIWDIPFCQVMNITESVSCKLVNSHVIRKWKWWSMFARAKHKNVSLCQYAPVPPVEKNLPDALALTDNELCKEMALNWKCEHLHKTHFVQSFLWKLHLSLAFK